MTLEDLVIELSGKEKKNVDVFGYVKGEFGDVFSAFLGPLSSVYEQYMDYGVQSYDKVHNAVFLEGVIEDWSNN